MALNKELVKEWLSDTHGYGIMDPRFFLDMGVSKEAVERLTDSHSDDPQLGKHAATRSNGEPGPVVGVPEFWIVDIVADELGVKPCHEHLGRGINFRTTRDAILENLSAGTEE